MGRSDLRRRVEEFTAQAQQMKVLIGSGRSFRNPVANGVISDNGLWIQLNEPTAEVLGDEFLGIVCSGEPTFVDDKWALLMVRAMIVATRLFVEFDVGDMTLILFYEPIVSDIAEIADKGVICFLDSAYSGEKILKGDFRPNQVPLYFKLRISKELAERTGIPENIERFGFVAGIEPLQGNPHLVIDVPRGTSNFQEVVIQ